jgi:hypothetical protein
MISPDSIRRYTRALRERESQDDPRVAANAAVIVAQFKHAPAEKQAYALRLLTQHWAKFPGLIEQIADIAVDMHRVEMAEALGWSGEAIEESGQLADELAANDAAEGAAE